MNTLSILWLLPIYSWDITKTRNYWSLEKQIINLKLYWLEGEINEMKYNPLEASAICPLFTKDLDVAKWKESDKTNNKAERETSVANWNKVVKVYTT